MKLLLRSLGTFTVLLILAAGCTQNSGSLAQMDSELRKLSSMLAPVVIELQVDTVECHTNVIAGSGLLLSSQGAVLTTASVIRDGKPLLAVLPDRRRCSVTLIGADWESNLALLRFDSTLTAPSVALNSAQRIAVGQLGFLVGTAPLIHGAFVAFGTMSNTELAGDDPYCDPMFAIMTGSILARPGAPVFDAAGNLIGMVEGRMYDNTSGCWTVVPMSTIRKVLPMLEQGGGISRGFLGIVPLPGSTSNGIEVAEVIAGSPAAKEGITTGDIITEIDDVNTKSTSTLRQQVTTKPNKSVDLRWTSHGKSMQRKITLSSYVVMANEATRNPFRKL